MLTKCEAIQIEIMSSTTRCIGYWPRRWSVLPIPSLEDMILVLFAIPGFPAVLNSSIFYVPRFLIVIPVVASQEPPGCDCGKTVEAAIAKGCQYDTLAAAWLPPHCRDDELTAELDRSSPGPNGEGTYVLDIDRTLQLTLEEVSRMADNMSTSLIHMELEWHLYHCTYYWRKQFRAWRSGTTVVEKIYGTEAHITHCSKILLDDTLGEHIWGTTARPTLQIDTYM